MLTTILAVTVGMMIPEHPSEIVFPEYAFNTPSAQQYRETIDGDITIYIAEVKELPLIQLVATFRGGGYLDPADKAGLVAMTASLVRDGGTTTISAEDLDEQFAYLAARASVYGGSTTVTATFNSLSNNFEEGLDLFLDMLQHPRFQESRIQLEKDALVEGMKQRNDYPSSILGRESRSLVYPDSYLSRDPVAASVESITVHDLRDMHATIFTPSNLILSISGDFDREIMLSLLNKKLAGWEAGAPVADPPDVNGGFVPGVYFVNMDVPQGGVSIGLRTLRMGDPDVEIASIMNHILGGGGFSSRITQKVRSDEGLAYSAGSALRPGVWSDGLWRAGFESKSSTVALAAKLVFEEIDRIREELVSEEELELAKSATIEQFPSMFQSKAATLGVFVGDELSMRDPAYWETYRDKIRSVSVEDVRRVANRLLRPRDMAVLVVGNWDDIEGGDLNGRATMEEVRSMVGGEIVELPLRDPLTLEVPNS